MKTLFYSLSIVLVTTLFLNGCTSTLSPTANPSLQAKATIGASSLKANCEQGLISMLCSDTITATFDQNGTLWVAFVNSNRIYVSASTDKGEHFSEPVVVNTVPENIAANGEYRPKIKLDSQGHIYLTWTQTLEKRHTGHIRFSRSVDDGNSFSKPITINDNLDIISHRFDDILIGQNDEIFIAWLDARDREYAKAAKQDFLGTAVYYTWSADGGEHFSPNRQVAPHSCECCRLAIALDIDNLPIVLWRHVFEGQIRDQAIIKFRDWNTPGSLQRASQDNWKIEACPHHGPALSIDSSGRYHLVWFSGAPDHAGLFYGYSDDQGMHYGNTQAFGNPGAKHPHIASVGDKVVIAWSEFDGKNNLIQSISSNDRGQHWSTARTLESHEGNADYAFLLSDGEDIYLSWQTHSGYRFRIVD